MNLFYNPEDKNIYMNKLNKNKKLLIILGVIAGLLFFIDKLLVNFFFRHIKVVAYLFEVFDILVFASYFIYLIIGVLYYRKRYTEMYRFLTKIEKYNKSYENIKIVSITDYLYTHNYKDVYELTLDDGRKVYIEEKFKDVLKNRENKALIMEGLLIGVEESHD